LPLNLISAYFTLSISMRATINDIFTHARQNWFELLKDFGGFRSNHEC